MAEANTIWIKVSILRNEAFGHRSNSNSVTDAFKKADITYDEFKKLIALSKILINKITLYYQRSTHAFNLGATECLIKLLDDLKELNATRSKRE